MASRPATPARMPTLVARVVSWVLVLGSGCKASASPEEVAEAVLFFPPVYRSVEEPTFSFTDAERMKALQEYRRQGADTLFELIVDPQGKVRKARIVKTWVKPIYHDIVLEHALALEFSPQVDTEFFRAFYYPLEYRFQSTFEWL